MLLALFSYSLSKCSSVKLIEFFLLNLFLSLELHHVIELALYHALWLNQVLTVLLLFQVPLFDLLRIVLLDFFYLFLSDLSLYSEPIKKLNNSLTMALVCYSRIDFSTSSRWRRFLRDSTALCAPSFSYFSCCIRSYSSIPRSSIMSMFFLSRVDLYLTSVWLSSCYFICYCLNLSCFYSSWILIFSFMSLYLARRAHSSIPGEGADMITDFAAEGAAGPGVED